MKPIAAGPALLAALLLTTSCSAGSTSGPSGGQDSWRLVLDGRPTGLSRDGTRDVSSCQRLTDGRLAMLWSGYAVDGSTEGTVTVFLAGDATVDSLSVRLNTGANHWESFFYGPGGTVGTTAAVVHHDGSYYRISGTLAGGGAAAPDTPVALDPPLHQFDLTITCVTNI